MALSDKYNDAILIARSARQAADANAAIQAFRAAGGIFSRDDGTDAFAQLQNLRVSHSGRLGMDTGTTDYSLYETLDENLVSFDPDTRSFLALKRPYWPFMPTPAVRYFNFTAGTSMLEGRFYPDGIRDAIAQAGAGAEIVFLGVRWKARIGSILNGWSGFTLHEEINQVAIMGAVAWTRKGALGARDHLAMAAAKTLAERQTPIFLDPLPNRDSVPWYGVAIMPHCLKARVSQGEILWMGAVERAIAFYLLDKARIFA